jgi:hypothetical protein
VSSISSASTLDQIKNSYLDNGSYQEDSDVGKARAFCTACRLLLLMLPQSTRKGDSELTLSIESIRSELKLAKQWLATANAAAAGGGIRYADFSNLRYP